MMTRQILILGATGQIAGHAIQALLEGSDAHLLLFTRHPQHLNNVDEHRETVIKGDTLKMATLDPAIAQADAVYANLRNPAIAQQAQIILPLQNPRHGLIDLRLVDLAAFFRLASLGGFSLVLCCFVCFSP